MSDSSDQSLAISSNVACSWSNVFPMGLGDVYGKIRTSSPSILSSDNKVTILAKNGTNFHFSLRNQHIKYHSYLDRIVFGPKSNLFCYQLSVLRPSGTVFDERFFFQDFSRQIYIKQSLLASIVEIFAKNKISVYPCIVMSGFQVPGFWEKKMYLKTEEKNL